MYYFLPLRRKDAKKKINKQLVSFIYFHVILKNKTMKLLTPFFKIISFTCFSQENDKTLTIKVKKQEKEIMPYKVNSKSVGKKPDSAYITFNPLYNPSDPNFCHPYSMIKQKPEFPNGTVAMKNFIVANIKYPISKCDINWSKECIISFIVEKDGLISNINIIKKVSDDWRIESMDNMGNGKKAPFECPGYDNEALRIVNSFPRFIPGKQNGKPVRVSMDVTIKFYLK